MKWNFTIFATGLKWRGNRDGLPSDLTYKIPWEEAEGVFATRSGGGDSFSVDPSRARPWLINRIKADYGKKPSNKFWFYLSHEVAI